MTTTYSLRSHFLVAMPMLKDPDFFHGVALVCEHNEHGAMGIVVNRPLELTLGEILSQMDIDCVAPDIAVQPVHLGGPVQGERGFVIHSPSGAWDAVLQVNETLAVTSSRDILEAMAQGCGPERAMVALGYAGWGPGQLEQEMMDNAWLSVPVDMDTLFNLPSEQRWQAAAAALGVDLNLLSGEAGHA